MGRAINNTYLISKICLLGSLLFLSSCLPIEDLGTKENESTGLGNATFTITPNPEGENGSNNNEQGNNQPDPTPQQPQVPSPPTIVIYDLILNSGAARTSSNDLSIELVAPHAIITHYKLGRSADCSDGTWEEYGPNSNWRSQAMPAQNAANTFSVQYRDYEFIDSECIVRTIVHDNRGPDIVISSYPSGTIQEGSAGVIKYSVTDVSPIKEVKCRLNSIEQVCGDGANQVNISAMPEGVYTFTIEATDDLNQSSSQTVSWSVVNSYRNLTQSVQVNNYNKVDILIVIDNSGSMNYEQQSMAQRVSNFISIISGLDWQIAVTTTDPMTTNNYPYVSDGKFLPIWGTNGQYILDSSSQDEDAQLRLGKTLQRPETGYGLEQGIYATYRVIERSLSAQNPAHQQFIRTGAHLAVLVISDEDESANGVKNDPQNLLQLVNTTYGGQKAFSWHSIITKPGDNACRTTNGATYGERYKTLSNLTGGIIGSVCATDYASQLSGIANDIRKLVKTLTLECLPQAGFPIAVTKDGVAYNDTYALEGVNMKFTNELPPGQYAVNYTCLR